jgi:ABC-type nickel/cobalt efflux system permease component RcnA
VCHQIALGLLLIVAFSLGLAGTIVGLGLVVVSARRFAGRVAALNPSSRRCPPPPQC